MAGLIAEIINIAEKIPVAGEIVRTVAAAFPQLEDEVTVEVVGGPGASKKQLYFMALAVANSLVRQFRSQVNGVHVTPPYGLLMLEYDAADNWVRCTMRYNTACTPIVFKDGRFLNRESRDAELGRLAIYSGPKCDVVGAPFDFTGTALGAGIGGIPRSSTSFPSPQLEFAGRTILTNCPQVKDPAPGFGAPGADVIPTPNPKPLGDNRSRGATVVAENITTLTSGGAAQPDTGVSSDDCCSRSLKFIPLVFASLSDPGSYGGQVFRQTTAGPRGG